MENWKKFTLSATAVATAALALAGCSSKSTSSAGASSKDVKGQITLWTDATHVQMYKPIVSAFEKKYPKVTVNLKQSPTGSANAKTDVGKDPSKAGDVFEVPNDQLGQMAQAGYVNPLSPSATKYVENNDVMIAQKGVTTNGKLYGYPLTVQAKVLFYNKSKFSSDDLKTWDSLTSKGKVAFVISDQQNSGPYTTIPMFLSNGVKLYGANGDKVKGSTFNSKEGEQVLQWFANQKKNPGVVDVSTAAISELKSGQVDADMEGGWDSTAIKAALGDNYAVTTYPTVDFGSGVKQMQSFVGIGAFAVNAQSKYQAADAALAEFLTNKTNQITAWKDQGEVPVNKDAQKDSSVADDQLGAAVIKQANFSTLMPGLPQMANMWTTVGPVTAAAYNGTLAPSQFSSTLTKINSQISKSVAK